VLSFADGPAFFVRQPNQSLAEFLDALTGDQPGLSAKEIEAVLKGADSLDLVEFVMEVEEAVRLQPPGKNTGGA
jgi:acyl carrier protein